MSFNVLFFRLYNRISFLIKAKGLHGTHSPFVYELIRQCIKPSRKTKIADIEELRKKLSEDHQLVEVVDFKRSRTDLRRISTITRTSLSTRKFSSMLLHLANYLQAESGLETGTSLGLNTLYLSHSHLKTITSIEGSKVIATMARKNIAPRSNTVRVINEDLYKVLEEEIVRAHPDFYFLDADHRSTAVAFCVDLILKHTPDAKCIVIHDIYWSKDMKEMWLQLTQDPRFNLSIDLFEGGLLFPNVEMPKQHFTLRF